MKSVVLALSVVVIPFSAGQAQTLIEFDLPGNHDGWFETTVNVNPGDRLSITASGCICFGTEPCPPSNAATTPEGRYCDSGVLWGPIEPDFLCLDGLPLSLVGKIGESVCFTVGSVLDIDVTESGLLTLAYNDRIGHFYDNTGEFNIAVTLDSPAPTGACCHSDGSCTIAILDECSPPDVWLGPDTDCDPNPCLQPAACCLSAFCEMLQEEECVSYGGSYQGEGTVCDPNPCPTSSVDAEGVEASEASINVLPNPTTGPITIDFALPTSGITSAKILHVSGRVVRDLFHGSYPHVYAGEFSLTWDGRDDAGRRVAAGVYVVRVETDDGEATSRIVLAR